MYILSEESLAMAALNNYLPLSALNKISKRKKYIHKKI